MNDKANNMQNEYRKLPSVDELLRCDGVGQLMKAYSRQAVTDALRNAISCARDAINSREPAFDNKIIIEQAEMIIKNQAALSFRRTINATGIIIHTGLGRSVLSESAQAAVAEVAAGHSNLEIDIETGKRGSRQEHVSTLLTGISGAESSLVVNNNAAAVILAINTLARGREIIISRGQLIEIGGAFRIPDIITRAGARLVEVGTTNRTRISDYAEAITEDTAIILRCHTSNYKISGFTEEASLNDLAALGKKHNIPVMDDLGSGAFIDISEFGLEHEPTVQESVSAGADLVCFSGDKLLGASQAGILVGRSDIIDECRSNPLARALRVDKLTLTALEATLRTYIYGDPTSDIPTLAALARSITDIQSQARKLVRQINEIGIDGLDAAVVNCESTTGGGSLPGQSLESWAVALKSSIQSADILSKHFRGNEPAIFGRIVKDTFLLDMRTVKKQEVSEIASCVRRLKC